MINHLFLQLFKTSPQVISQAPGRAEIIGNHTDYNNGYALSAAINRKTTTYLSKRDDREVHVFSTTFSKEPSVFSLDQIEKGLHGDWLNYIKGLSEKFSLTILRYQG